MYGTCETLCRELAAQYTENTPLMLVVWSPDNCPVPWQSLPHRKGPLRGETPKKWTAEGAFAPPGEQPVGPAT